MAPRGKHFKGKKRQHSGKKFTKSRNKRDKPFSIHKNKYGDKKTPTKRFKDETDVSNIQTKRQKIEDQVLMEVHEEEEEDHIKRLLETFGSNIATKKNVAVDSSDDGTSEDEQPEEESAENSEEKSDDESESQEHQSSDIKSGLNNVNIVFNEEDEVDAEVQKEDEDTTGDLNDPFARHLFYEMSDNLLTSVQNIPKVTVDHTLDWPVLGKLQLQIPKCEQEENPAVFSIMERKPFAPLGSLPSRIHNASDFSLESVHIKTQISHNIANANKCCINLNRKFPFTSLQSEIFSIINNYQDFYYTHRTFENAEEIRFVYCLHIVNHILKTRTKVLHHNARLNKKDEVPEQFRDQGLVRPKILVVVPFRDSAYRIINMLIDVLISEDKGNVINKSRFMEEFTGHEIVMPKKNPKPEDYEVLFSGNTGDDFRIGITVTKKSLKLFADFYSSDIIIASPLGLRTIIGAEGEPDRDYDFLASIELLILDQTEIFLMQNWDHLLHALNHLHLQPKESHGTDFSRVRIWSLNGWAKYYRQTLIFSSITLPEINAIFNKKCFNYAGKVKSVNLIPLGSICQVYLQLPHVFHKFNADNISQSVEARFNFFINKILPQQRETLLRQTLIFVSNYFDFVRLRNYFKKEDIGFVQICEYSKEGKVARARDIFFHGDAHFLLYTERYHFFNRVRIKGIRHIVFYQPPLFPNFYYEMCNFMQESNMNKKIGSMSNMTVTVLYSKYDVYQLAAIVGTERATRMIQSNRNVHMLVTDGK